MQLDQESNNNDKFNVPERLCRRFSLDEIVSATNGFNDSFVIGQGGFAKVYKGQIDNGALTVAIKKSKSMSPELRKEFRDEILMVSRFRHTHLVSLIGYCETDNEMILVYEYMACGTLEDHLHKLTRKGNTNNVPLCWIERLKICIGVARGLDYLHTGTGINNKVIHRDVKSSNILLDENRTIAKISDFGLSKIGPANQEDTRVMTRVVGTFGYLDPDYHATGMLTSKSDVYAFGVVLFELLCGRPAVDPKLDEVQRSLAVWARLCVKKGKVGQIIDPILKSEILPCSLSVYLKIANRCLNTRPKDRPIMTAVLAELVLALSLQENGKRNSAKGSKLAEKLMLLFSVTPRSILGNSAEFDATAATANDMEDAPNEKQFVNIERAVVSSVQLDELKNVSNNFGTNPSIGEGETCYGILNSSSVSFTKELDSNKLTAVENSKTLAYHDIKEKSLLRVRSVDDVETLACDDIDENFHINLEDSETSACNDIDENSHINLEDSEDSEASVYYDIDEDFHINLEDSETSVCPDIDKNSFLNIKPDKIQIFVKTWSGKTIALYVQQEDAISDVKVELSHKLCMTNSKCYYYLMFGGKRLDNHRNLESYGIKKQSTLHMGMASVCDDIDENSFLNTMPHKIQIFAKT